MNIMEPPGQSVVALAATDTEGVTVVVVIVTGVLVAVAGVAQGSLEVMITVTASLLARDEEVNVAEVAPGTSTPLTCH